MKRILLAAVSLAVLTIVLFAARALLDERRRVGEIMDLRDRLYAARVSADSCRNELAYEERIFRRFDEVVDSLRGAVRAYEELDERGVPQEEYQDYLTEFEGYNDSVATWEARAEALQASEAGCRALVERHNVLTDSLRTRLLDEGIGESESP